MKLYEAGSWKRLLGLSALFMILLWLLVNSPQPTVIPESSDAETLYHVTWQVTSEHFYNQEKLQGWSDWEHKFDGQLKTQQDAEAAVNQMLGSLGDRFTVLLSPNGTATEAAGRKGVGSTKPMPVVSFGRLPNSVGYIKIVSFETDNMVRELVAAVQALKTCRGLVIDLRGNPGGQVNNAIWAAAAFLERGHVTTTRTRMGGRLVEKQFSLTPEKLVVASLVGERPTLDTQDRLVRQESRQPLVVLVNEASVSGAEMFAGALQDNGRALVVGMKTFGKGIGQNLIPMPNGTMLIITSLRYYTPKMRWVGDASGGLFSNGIMPDVVVAADKTAGCHDNQLTVAVESLAKLIAR